MSDEVPLVLILIHKLKREGDIYLNYNQKCIWSRVDLSACIIHRSNRLIVSEGYYECLQDDEGDWEDGEGSMDNVDTTPTLEILVHIVLTHTVHCLTYQHWDKSLYKYHELLIFLFLLWVIYYVI